MKKLDKTSSHSSSFVELKQNIFAEVKKHNKKLCKGWIIDNFSEWNIK